MQCRIHMNEKGKADKRRILSPASHLYSCDTCIAVYLIYCMIGYTYNTCTSFQGIVRDCIFLSDFGFGPLLSYKIWYPGFCCLQILYMYQIVSSSVYSTDLSLHCVSHHDLVWGALLCCAAYIQQPNSVALELSIFLVVELLFSYRERRRYL